MIFRKSLDHSDHLACDVGWRTGLWLGFVLMLSGAQPSNAMFSFSTSSREIQSKAEQQPILKTLAKPNNPSTGKPTKPNEELYSHVLPKAFRPVEALKNGKHILIWSHDGRILTLNLKKNLLREISSSFTEIDQGVVDTLGFLLLGRTRSSGHISLMDFSGQKIQQWKHEQWSSVFSTPTCRVAMGALGDLNHLHLDGSRKILWPPKSVPLTQIPMRYVMHYRPSQQVYCSVGDYQSKSGDPRGECRSHGLNNWLIQDYWDHPPIACGSFILATTIAGQGNDQTRTRKVWSLVDGKLIHTQRLTTRNEDSELYCSAPNRVTSNEEPSSTFKLPFLLDVGDSFPSTMTQRCKSSSFRRRLENLVLCIDQRGRMYVNP